MSRGRHAAPVTHSNLGRALITSGAALAVTTGSLPVVSSASAAPIVLTDADVTNSSGPLKAVAQAAADAVVDNVPGAASIVMGGTRASAIDPNGHPSGLAVDYMVLGNTGLGNAIVQYHIDHWDELGVEYLIYRQRILLAPNGDWRGMENRGSATANHMDHVHANYRADAAPYSPPAPPAPQAAPAPAPAPPAPAPAAEASADWRALWEANREVIGDNPDLILPGQVLTIPGSGEKHTVRSGECLSVIARDHATARPAPTPAPPPAPAPAPEPRATPAPPVQARTLVPGATLTSTFGARWGAHHNGIDLAAPVGTPIYAAVSGTVLVSGLRDPGGFGAVVYIANDEGGQTWYGHIDSWLVAAGRHVTAGQQIATVGQRGHVTGPHLHFEVRTDSGPIDPGPWLARRGVRI